MKLELVINGMNRASQFDEVLEAMDALQISAEQRHAIFRLISAVPLVMSSSACHKHAELT